LSVARAQVGDGLLEVLDGAERLIDTGEAEIGHLVELSQRAKDGEANLVARHLGSTRRTHRVLHGLGQLSQLILIYWATLTGPSDTVDDLGTTERLGNTASLDDGQGGLLDCRE